MLTKSRALTATCAAVILAVAVFVFASFNWGSSVSLDDSPATSGPEPRVGHLVLEIDPVSGAVDIVEPQERGRSGLASFVSEVFAEELVTAQLSVVPGSVSTGPLTSEDGGFRFPISVDFRNDGSDLPNVFSRVAELAYSDGGTPAPRDDNAQRCGTGVGSEQDGVAPLLSGSTVPFVYNVFLPRRAPFTFIVNLFTGVPLLCAVADLNDDGLVDESDVDELSRLAPLGVRAGEAGYREGLDLNADGIIDAADVEIVRAHLGATDVPTSPTTLRGTVFDGLGNRLPGVKVVLGSNTLETITDENGFYSFDNIPADHLGDQLITFDGSTAVDPTPGFLSGQYPTIPNKPIFVNGGTENVFRDISLPELE